MMKGNGLMKRKIRALFSLVIIATSIVTPVHATTLKSQCIESTSGSGSSLSNDCKFPYPDSGDIISPIYTCHHFNSVSGRKELTDPGSDFLLDARFLSIGTKGNVLAPQQLAVTALVSQECQKRGDAYRLSGYVTSATGIRYPINFGNGNFLPAPKVKTATDYCYLESNPTCGFTAYQGSLKIPSNATTGNYSVSLSVIASTGSVAGVKPVTDKYSDVLLITQTTSQTPSASPSVSPTNSANTGIVVNGVDIDSAFMDASTHPKATVYLANVHLNGLPSVINQLQNYARQISIGSYVACIGYVYAPSVIRRIDLSQQVAQDQATAACTQLKKANPAITVKAFTRSQSLAHKHAKELGPWSPGAYRLDIGVTNGGN